MQSFGIQVPVTPGSVWRSLEGELVDTSGLSECARTHRTCFVLCGPAEVLRLGLVKGKIEFSLTFFPPVSCSRCKQRDVPLMSCP